jgi:hypothetical protein
MTRNSNKLALLALLGGQLPTFESYDDVVLPPGPFRMPPPPDPEDGPPTRKLPLPKKEPVLVVGERVHQQIAKALTAHGTDVVVLDSPTGRERFEEAALRTYGVSFDTPPAVHHHDLQHLERDALDRLADELVARDHIELGIDYAALEFRTYAAATTASVKKPHDPRDAIVAHLTELHRLGKLNMRELSPEQKHAWATRGEKLREDGPTCAMCGLLFSFKHAGCIDYADRRVHTWCEQRKPTPERLAGIAAVDEALAQCGWRGTVEERRARAETMLEDLPDHQIEEFVRSRARAMAKAEAKRARKAEAWAKQQKGCG